METGRGRLIHLPYDIQGQRGEVVCGIPWGDECLSTSTGVGFITCPACLPHAREFNLPFVWGVARPFSGYPTPRPVAVGI